MKKLFLALGGAFFLSAALTSCGKTQGESKATSTVTSTVPTTEATAEPTTTVIETVTTTVPTTEALAKTYDFIIYEPDSDNTNLSDNKVVATYHIEYTESATYVSDTLIKKDDKYYFNSTSKDYLVLVDSSYGLSYSQGYFENYSKCANDTAIDVSWSRTSVNGVDAMTGIGTTPLDGLTTYGFVIDGWK